MCFWVCTILIACVSPIAKDARCFSFCYSDLGWLLRYVTTFSALKPCRLHTFVHHCLVATAQMCCASRTICSCHVGSHFEKQCNWHDMRLVNLFCLWFCVFQVFCVLLRSAMAWEDVRSHRSRCFFSSLWAAPRRQSCWATSLVLWENLRNGPYEVVRRKDIMTTLSSRNKRPVQHSMHTAGGKPSACLSRTENEHQHAKAFGF